MEQSKVFTAGLSPPIDDTTNNSKAKDSIRVVSVFVGSKSASEAIHSAAVKKILYDKVKSS